LSASTGLKIGSVVIDCINFEEMLEFWQETLHYVPRQPAEGGWVVLIDPDGRNTSVSLNRVQPSEKLTGRNWLHFDLYTKEQTKEVERLLNFGAKRHPQDYDPEDDFVVLEDPDGNLFCIVQLGHNLRNTDPV
jgi:catechol 2,3-dioxygenase-like lactoylglutathione lyase family enzyme